ncbi:MAG: peptidoglycan DD-metalloendopeptidase family protein [Gammaproteobacteria bacterium]
MIRCLFCLALALFLSSPATTLAAREPGRAKAPPTARKTAPKTAEELARVRDRIRDLEKQNRDDLAKRGDLDRQLRSAETAAARSRQELAGIRAQLVEAQRRLAELTRQLDATRADLQKQRTALAGQLRLAHITGGSERVRAVFSQQDPAEVGRRLTWLAYLARTRSELLGSIQASLEALERDQQAVAEQEASLAEIELRRRSQLAELDGARQQRAGVVASLDAQVRGQKQQLARARSQAAELERVLRDLKRAAAQARRNAPPAGGSSAPLATGKPLGKGRWPVAGEMLADFGQPRAGGQLRWDGVLISAPAGSEVRAVQPGRVVYADWLPGLGLLLVLDHGGGYLSLYGHNQDLTRAVGDRLAGGDVLAHVGDTGGQPRPALYYEVRRNGQPVNPRGWGN